ncbi:MAG: type II secretion system F family protein [archaeon]
MLFYTYPSVIVSDRKKRIDDSLPFATLYLATISGSGTPPIAMFRALANFKEYGEISKEAERIIEETDVLGVNLALAIENAANRTPSDHLRDIFWGIKSILVVGGDLQRFLHEKAISTMQEYKRRLAQFTQQLSMYIEMYITVVIVGSVFFMVLTTIMGSMSADPKTTVFIVAAQFLVSFIFLPLASFGFMILIKGIAPSVKA